MLFTEALQYALGRVNILPDEYYNVLTDTQRQSSVSIAGLAQLEHVEHIIGLVNKTIENGKTFKDFVDELDNSSIDINLPKHRLDNIFRTNIQNAYNKGRYEQQFMIRRDRPYLMYSAINDSRTRPTHLAMNKILLPFDDKFWETNYPPNGYRCRCNVLSLTVKQMEKMGGVTKVIPENAYADKGWAVSPKDCLRNLTELVKNYQPTGIKLDTTFAAVEAARQIILQLTDDVDTAESIDKMKSIAVNNDAVKYLSQNPDIVETYKALNLTEAEILSLTSYTNNRALVTKYILDPIKFLEENPNIGYAIEDQAAQMLKALKKIPRYRGETIVRSPLTDALKELKVGDTYINDSFMSGFNNNKKIKNPKDDVFSGRPVRLSIKSKTGKKLESLGIHNQAEVLFEPGKKFSVEKIYESSEGDLWITMSEI